MRREVLKTASYGMMHLMVAIAVTYFLTRDWRIALGVGLIEPLVQTFAYNLHEHVWRRSQSPDKKLADMEPELSAL